MKNNAAIYLLSSRTLLLEQCLNNLFKNWNNQFNYPVYVHYFDDIYDKKYIEKIKNKISNKIFFHQIEYKVPDHINEKDLFYNKKYIPYVKNSFPKKRLGYLHGERFWLNLTSYGEHGCLVKELEKFDFLMRIDDDSNFKGKINFDLFDILKSNPIATAYTDNKFSDRVRDTRLGLFEFYTSYLKKYKYSPKNQLLKKAIDVNDESIMHSLPWTAGNCNLYNIIEFKKAPWDEYLSELNNYGGHYKHRWGDLETIGLFCFTHFEKNPHDFNLKNKGLYDDKFPSSLSSYAPGVGKNLNEHNFFIIRLIKAFKFKLKKIFNIKK